MDTLRQYFWLWIGFSIIIVDSAVCLTLYLMHKRIFKANQCEDEKHIEGLCTLRCFRNGTLSETSHVPARHNTYQMNSEHDYENELTRSNNKDNTSHDYEAQPDLESTLIQDNIKLEVESEEDYDDILVPDLQNEDYDDIDLNPTL